MSLAILRAMTSSAECSMGLRSFLASDEPLSAGRLKLSDSRLCEELEIKSLMRSSPLTHSTHNSYSTKGPPPSLPNGTSKHFEYATESVSSTASNTTTSSCCSSTHRRRQSINNCATCAAQNVSAKQTPSRTPSTASTSISSATQFRQQKLVSQQQQKGNHVEYTEPTILVTHNHLQQAIESHGPTSSAPANIVQPTSLQRCESSNSVADKEICATLLRNRSRTESEMADDDDLLDEEAGKLRNNDRLVDDFDHMHLNGSLGPRRRILPQTINKEQVLSYIANTNNIFIRRSGTELQVTDSTGFPLIDVWQKNRCFQSSSWVLESYGRTVLLLHSIGRPWKPWAMRKTMPVLEVESSDDELLGYFVTADPFIIQNRDRQVVARFNSFDSGDGRTILYQCLLECSGEEICRLEPRKSQLSQLRFGQGCSTFPLKLLVLAAAVRIAAMQALNTQPNHSVSPGTRRPTKRRNKSSCCSIV